MAVKIDYNIQHLYRADEMRKGGITAALLSLLKISELLEHFFIMGPVLLDPDE